MSIYGSWEEIGEDDHGEPDGTVLAYQRSHLFPRPEWSTAALGIAHIPAWCVPGSEVEYDDEAVARFLRLDVRETGDMVTSTVVLHEQAVRKLHEQLTAWLARPKVDPIPTPEEP